MRKTETRNNEILFCEKLFTILPLIQGLSGRHLSLNGRFSRSLVVFGVLAENVEKGGRSR